MSGRWELKLVVMDERFTDRDMEVTIRLNADSDREAEDFVMHEFLSDVGFDVADLDPIEAND